MELICPDSRCPNHSPGSFQWFDFHGSYLSCGRRIQRFRCRSCRRTFSRRTLSIDFWTHRRFDYLNLICLLASGCSLRSISRLIDASVNTVQNRIGRLARTVLPALSRDTVKFSGWASLRIISYAAAFSTSSPSLNTRPAWTSSSCCHFAILCHPFSAS